MMKYIKFAAILQIAAALVIVSCERNDLYSILDKSGIASDKQITAFSFVAPSVNGTIDQGNNLITLTVPFGTALASLVPAITHTGESINPASGVANDFSSPAVYTVTAADLSTRNYTVTVTVSSLPVLTTTDIAGNFDFTIYIEGMSAMGGGNISNQGESAITDRGLCWNTTGNPLITDSIISDGTGIGTFSTAAITGLTENTTYYVRAYATNAQGTAYGNEISFNSGWAFDVTVRFGGHVFYNNGFGGGLVAATGNPAPALAAWISGGATATTLNGNTGTGIGTGSDNSAFIKAQADHIDSGALVCENYTGGGFTDWFLPSKDELDLMYINLHVNLIGAYTANPYWSSSEDNATQAWIQNFGSGAQIGNAKGNSAYIRPVRAF